MSATPSAAIIIRVQGEKPFYEAKFRHDGRQVKRRIGPAWLERDETRDWRPRRGRVQDGYYDERRAHAAAAQTVSQYLADAADIERIEHERRSRGITFREVAQSYLSWLDDVKGAKPSTLADYRYLLAEPGVPYKRRVGESAGHIMEALGNLSAAKVSVRDVDTLLATVSKAGRSARNVNKHRALVAAIFNYGIKDSAFSLPPQSSGSNGQAKGSAAGPPRLLYAGGG
jgi:hypothetical protein